MATDKPDKGASSTGVPKQPPARQSSTAIPRQSSTAIPRQSSTAIPRQSSPAIPRQSSPAIPRQPDDALSALLAKAATSVGGPAVEALERAAEMLHARGDAEEGLYRLEEALRRADEGAIDPRVVARIAVTAALLHESTLGRLDRAVELLELAHKLDPDQPRAIEAGRRIYAAIGDLPRVARLYEIELETAPPGNRGKRAELLVALANLREKLGDLAAAAERLEQAMVADPLTDLRERIATLWAGAHADDEGELRAQALRRAAELFRVLGKEHGAAGRREDEIAAYRRALGAAPDDIEAARGLESAYRKSVRIADLQRLYQQAPWLPGASRHVAELTMAALVQPGPSSTRAARLGAAVDALSAAAQAGEEVADLLQQLESHLESADDHRKAAQLYEQVLPLGDERDPLDRADRLVVIAKHHRAGGDLLRFETSLLDALEAYPSHDEAYALITEHLTARRDYATLVALAEAALGAAPADEHARRLEELAELYDKRLGDVAGAIETWTRRQAIGHLEKADVELRRLKIKQERWAGLVANLDKELELAQSPDLRAEVLRRLGQIHRERHDLERARALFGEALELRPQDPSLYRTLGEIAELEGRFDELAKLLRRQYAAAKERVERLNLLRRLAALYEERLADWDGVRWACEQILSLLPSDRDALVRLAQGHETEGNVEALLEVLEAHANTAATPAEKIELYRRLARTHEAGGQVELAAERWERIVRIDKTDAAATRALAVAYDTLERSADASLAYARLLEPQRGGASPAAQLDETELAATWRSYARLLDQKLGDSARARPAWEALLELRPADREALEALTELHRRGTDRRALEALLERRLAVARGDEATQLSLELALLFRARRALPEARDRIETLLTSLGSEGLGSPDGQRALGLAVELAEEAGDPRGAIVALERRYFATDGADRLPLARTIAQRWSTVAPQGGPTLLAWERVLRLAPDDHEALGELSSRYATAAMYTAQRSIDLHRLELAEQAVDRTRAVELGEALARLVEDQLGDPQAAFHQLERVLGVPGQNLHGRVLDALRTLAERRSLWTDLARVLADERDLELRIERALLLEEKLREPRRAFDVLRDAVRSDVLPTLGPPTRTAGFVVPHLLRLGDRIGETVQLLDALRDLVLALPRAEQVKLLVQRAEVREQRSKDASGAFDELVRAVPLVDGNDARDGLDAELRRLGQAARRYEDLLALVSLRAAQAARGSARRAALLDEAAKLAEVQLHAPLRAFRVRLTMLAQLEDPLAPPPAVEHELWRLATTVGRAGSVPARAEDSSARRTLVPALAAEIPAATVQTTRPVRDATMEVQVGDLIIESKPARGDATMELQPGDLALAMRGAPPPVPQRSAPPPLPGVRQSSTAIRPPPPLPAIAQPLDGAWLVAAPVLDVPLVELPDPHGSWDELAAVLHRAEQEGNRPTTRARLVVARTFEEGAQDPTRALDELRDAFLEAVRSQSPSSEVRTALEALATKHDADDRLVEILDEAIAATSSQERAIALLLDTATVRQRQGKLDDAEARYRRALGIRPGLRQASEWLEAHYRAQGRLDLLATLLEQRLDSIVETSQSTAQALELADIYDRSGQRYEAIGTIEALLSREPRNAEALLRLTQLYEALAQWGKVIDVLGRRIELLEDRATNDPGARELRLRVADLYERELERPERALDAYLALDRGAHSPAIDEALERLLRQLGRFGELDALWARRGGDRPATLRRRLELLHEHPHANAKLEVLLRELSTLAPDDDAVLAELEPLLGDPHERIELVSRRLQLAEARGAAPETSARLLQQLATLEAQVGDVENAVHALEQASALLPDAADIAASLAELRARDEDPSLYTEARQREAALAPDDHAATRALIAAARASLDPEQARVGADAALARCPADLELLGELRAIYEAQQLDERIATVLRRELELVPETGVERARRLVALGHALERLGDLDAATASLHHAHDAEPGFAPAVHGLADLAERSQAWDDVEPALRYAATAPGVSGSDSAALHRRLAEAATARGNHDDAYAALLEADRRKPGDVRTRAQLGRNRYALGRFREAAQHLGAVAEHADLPRLGKPAAQALYEGAQAELKQRRPERATALLEIGLTLDPAHEPTLGLLASQAQAKNDVARATELLARQAAATPDPVQRAQRWEQVAKLLTDTARVREALSAAVASWDAAGTEVRPPVATLDALLDAERAVADLRAAASTAGRLLLYSASPSERARRLRESAALEAALGNDTVARDRLASALELDPLDAETVAGYSALLVRLGEDEPAATLLTRVLTQLPPPTSGDGLARAMLWQRLGEVRDRQRDAKGAAVAFERVLELAPDRRPLRLLLLERYGEDPAHATEVAAHRRFLLDVDPLDLASLRAKEALERRLGHRAAADVVATVQAVAGALALGRPVPPPRAGEPSQAPVTLSEAELLLLEHPEATALAEVFDALYEGVPQDQLADLAALGVDASTRVSPVSDAPAAALFTECARLLGNRRTALYVKADARLAAPLVCVRAPTAVVLSPELAALPAGEVRFLVGRALWLVRPEHALVVGLSKSRLNSMLMSVVHALHPRHAAARAASDAEVQQLRKTLPYKALKRLGDLFQREADTHFSSSRWRRGVEHSANRAGLVVSGDFRAAARVLHDEGDLEGLRELARFALSDSYLALRSR